MKKIRLFALALSLMLATLVAAIGATGCGGDSEEDTQPKAQYIKQADAVCGKTEGRQNALVKEVLKEPKIKNERKAFTRTVEIAGIPPLQKQVEELEDLAPPEPGAEEAEAFLTEFKNALGEVEEDPPSISEAPNPFEKAEKMAKEFGFKVCGGA